MIGFVTWPLFCNNNANQKYPEHKKVQGQSEAAV